MTDADTGWRQEELTASAITSLSPEEAASLAGKTAIVTGAAGGIGRWLAAGLGAAGAAVVLTDLDPYALGSVEKTLRSAGISCATEIGDLAVPEARSGLVGTALEVFGGIDVLVNCAAVNRRRPIEDVSEDDFDFLLDVDLKAPYFLAKDVARVMIDAGRGGSIINIGSINVAVGLEGVSVYGSAKAALSQLTKVMAVEWSHHGIRANCLSPGFMLTPLSEQIWTDPERRRWIVERVPMRRPGFPRELVGACILLASDAASFISGQTIFVDGGFLAGSRWSGGEAEDQPSADSVFSEP